MIIKTAQLSLFVYFDISRCMDNYYIIIIYIYICIMREHLCLATFLFSFLKTPLLQCNLFVTHFFPSSSSLCFFFAIKEWKDKSKKEMYWFVEFTNHFMKWFFFGRIILSSFYDREWYFFPQCIFFFFFDISFIFFFYPRLLLSCSVYR